MDCSKLRWLTPARHATHLKQHASNEIMAAPTVRLKKVTAVLHTLLDIFLLWMVAAEALCSLKKVGILRGRKGAQYLAVDAYRRS